MADYKGQMEDEISLGASLMEAHEAVSKDFDAAIDGFSDLSEDAVEALGGLLGLDDSND